MTTVTIEDFFDNEFTLRDIADKPVDVALVEKAWEHAKWMPTAFNAQPMRIDVTHRGSQARSAVVDAASPSNKDRVENAPLVAVLSYDPNLKDSMVAFGAPDAMADMAQSSAEAVGQQSGALQAGYFMTALRALGIAVGPMTGIRAEKIDAALHGENGWKTMMIVCLGYHGDEQAAQHRPRPSFSDIAAIHGAA